MTIFMIVLCLLILAGGGLLWGKHHSTQQIDAEIGAVLPSAPDSQATFSHADLDGLPETVQNYLKRSVPEGYPYMHSAHVKQYGTMRLNTDEPWRDFTAEQYFNADQPGFVWHAQMSMVPLISVRIRDKYLQQWGSMRVEMVPGLPITEEEGGGKFASSALMRYLAEMMWFPTGMLNQEYIQWDAIDDHTARATITDGDITADVDFHFAETGDVERIEAMRYMNSDDEQPTRWFGICHGYKEFDGVRIPSYIHVGWEPDSGEYIWWRGQIDSIDYNVYHLEK